MGSVSSVWEGFSRFSNLDHLLKGKSISSGAMVWKSATWWFRALSFVIEVRRFCWLVKQSEQMITRPRFFDCDAMVFRVDGSSVLPVGWRFSSVLVMFFRCEGVERCGMFWCVELLRMVRPTLSRWVSRILARQAVRICA